MYVRVTVLQVLRTISPIASVLSCYSLNTEGSAQNKLWTLIVKSLN